jgi:hypothetical protein
MSECICGSGEQKWAEYDARGIFLTYVCDHCRKEKLSKYRPEILSGYTQADVDEPIEAEEW